MITRFSVPNLSDCSIKLSRVASEKILPKTKEITLRLILIYLILTFLCSFFYNICGMEFFDSLTHSMTTIATGGFSNYNESIGYFNNIKIEINNINCFEYLFTFHSILSICSEFFPCSYENGC